ncbi:antA/AntB antirepressor family protein [Lacrimispora sp.]|uniref:antA/AntB antirepressor family protein n=1 Tax=Lacrimispora sp. TaxID=2719234 RepID=UPI002896F7E6|nr:antA/AntB antirepressor family protein [Lacrimispora sp.]
MNDLMDLSMADTSNLTPIESVLGIDEDGMTTAKKLYEFLELNPSNYSKWCRRNILENEFAEENIDYWAFVPKDEREFNPNPTQDFKLTAHFAKKLSMTQKNERGEQAREYFTRVEDGAKKMILQFQDMSPQLQYMIKVEQEQKRQAQEIAEVKDMVQTSVTRVESIREVVALDTTSWRGDTRNLINKMAQELGGGQAFQQVRAESYELLEKRMGVSLKQRLTNKRRRMADEGVCKSKRDKLSQVDIIAEDKKLIEGYTAIVKEMAIKYGAA